MIAGSANYTLPPYADLLGISISDSPENGEPPTLSMPFHDGLAGRPGMLHGGAIAGLLDMAANAALTASLRAGGQASRFKPIGMTIDYVRAGKEKPTLARGRVTRIGRRVATVIVEAWQDDDSRHIAAARIHMLLSSEAI